MAEEIISVRGYKDSKPRSNVYLENKCVSDGFYEMFYAHMSSEEYESAALCSVSACDTLTPYLGWGAFILLSLPKK